MGYTGSFKFDSLVTFALKHEKCHGLRAVHYLQNTASDVGIFSERQIDETRVDLESKIFGALQAQVVDITTFADSMDVSGPAFSFWSRDTGNTNLLTRTLAFNGVLRADAICT
jgi:hypothetical protein